MPDRRKHRGPHPADAILFGQDAQPMLREAVLHLSWLLSRGYASTSALKLVGDRFRLTERQRTAVSRSACADETLRSRLQSEAYSSDVAGSLLLIDGFNLLTTIESALAGGVILAGRDGCYRDMASMHGNYCKVEETRPALQLIGKSLEKLPITTCRWYLDRPVSNSGRLSAIIGETAAAEGWNWSTHLVADPDRILAESTELIATADSWILDRASRWFNLAAHVVRHEIKSACVVAMCDTAT